MSEKNKKEKTYYAHSVENQTESQWQTMYSHGDNVGNKAAEFAVFFGAQEIARSTGWLHDLGKYSEPFDKRLHGGPSVDHATAGAKIAVERFGDKVGKLMAFCIAGHHAGLANGEGEGDNRRTLTQRLALAFGKDIPDLDPVWQQEIVLPEKLPAPPLKADAHHKWFSYAFFTRMLYSCLVDADFLDTEAFYASVENNTIQRGGHPDLKALQQRFNTFIEAFRRSAEQRRRPPKPNSAAPRSTACAATFSTMPSPKPARRPGCLPLPYPPAAAKPSPPWRLHWNTPSATACAA